MHDIPYLNRQVGPEIVASMSVVCNEVKKEANNLPCGIQILAGANKEALAVAKAAGLQFIRAEGFVFSHIADEGTMNSDAGELLRYRKQIEAGDILVFTDIKKKHRYVLFLLAMTLKKIIIILINMKSDKLTHQHDMNMGRRKPLSP